MPSYEINSNLAPMQLDTILRADFGDGVITGISKSPNRTLVHFLVNQDISENRRRAAALGNLNFDLTINQDKSVILADDTDTATITCIDPVIGGAAAVGVTLYENGVLDTETTEAVVGGVATIQFTADAPGEYIIKIAHGNLTAYAIVNAIEV